jgi:acetylglutamate kinase
MKVVLKLGGELIHESRRGELAVIAEELRALLALGARVVVVHGGGPQTSALQEALGQTPRMIGGRRVTDEAALDVLKMMVGGKLNVDLVGALRGAGVDAVGLHGVSGRLIACERRPPRAVTGGGPEPVDFGWVGDVTGVNLRLLDLLLDAGFTPVLACIGSDAEGRAFNINADMVASGVAAATSADRLLLLTNTPGVLGDVRDPGSRIPRLTRAEAADAIARGVISGGMIAKVEEAFDAVARGVAQVHVLGRVAPGDLVRAMTEPGSVGTAFLP